MHEKWDEIWVCLKKLRREALQEVIPIIFQIKKEEDIFNFQIKMENKD